VSSFSIRGSSRHRCRWRDTFRQPGKTCAKVATAGPCTWLGCGTLFEVATGRSRRKIRTILGSYRSITAWPFRSRRAVSQLITLPKTGAPSAAGIRRGCR